MCMCVYIYVCVRECKRRIKIHLCLIYDLICIHVRMSTNICIYEKHIILFLAIPFHLLLLQWWTWKYYCVLCIVYCVLCIGVVAWELSYSSKNTSRKDSKMRSLCASSPDSAVQTDFETFKHSIVTLTLRKQRATYCGANEVKSPSSRQSRSTLALLTGCR